MELWTAVLGEAQRLSCWLGFGIQSTRQYANSAEWSGDVRIEATFVGRKTGRSCGRMKGAATPRKQLPHASERQQELSRMIASRREQT